MISYLYMRSLPLIEGEGGGEQNQPVEFHFFFAWKSWDSDPTPRMEL